MNRRKIVVIGGACLFIGVFLYTLTSVSRVDKIKQTDIELHHEDNNVVRLYEIYPGDVVGKIERKEEVILLDVRTLEEYEGIHLENALLLPVQILSQQTLTDIGLGEDMKDKEIILYCRSGNRSKTAYDVMKSLGYTNVKSVAGGMIHWEEDDYPFTESGSYVKSSLMEKK